MFGDDPDDGNDPDGTDDTSIMTAIQARVEALLPDRVRGSYSAKFILTLLLVVVLIGAIGVYIHFDTQRYVTQDTQEEITGIAREESSRLGDWVNGRRSNTKFLAASLPAEANESVLQPNLERKLVQLPNDVQELHVVDTEAGRVVSSTKTKYAGATLDDVDATWTRNREAVTRGSVAVSEPYSTGDDPLVAFRIQLSEDRYVVLAASLAEQSKRFNSPIAIADIKVVNAEKTIVFDNQNGNLLAEYTLDGSESAYVREGLNGTTGFATVSGGTGMGDGDYVMAYTPVTGTDWVLLIHVPQDDAFALQSQITQNLAILVVVALVGIGIVGLTIGRTTARRLDELSETASALAQGQLDVSVPESNRVDEMGSLLDSFEGLHSYLNTVADRAEALADQDFDADVLDEDVPGTFGDTLDRMGEELERMVNDLEDARAQAEAEKEQAEESKERAETAKQEAEAAKRDAEAARQEAEALTEALEEKAIEFGQVMDRAADGDLTVRMDPDSPSDEMERIARSFNEMLEDIERTVRHIQEVANNVDASSTEVQGSVEEISNTSQEVTESIQHISEGLEDQNESVQEIANEMSNLSATVEEVASSAEDVAKTADQAAEQGRTTRAAADEAIEEMEDIKTQSRRTAEEIEKLENEMEQIDDVVGVIEEIAEQTNMLALNANIEAAKADGDGFAVVANEVKQLAEEVGEETTTVSDHIEEVRETTERSTADMREMRDHVLDGTETIEDALGTLDAVVEEMEEANNGVQSIDDATDQQATSTEEVAAMADEIAEISKRTNRQADDVATAAEQQSAATENIRDTMNDLANEAETLEELVDQFEVSG